TVAHVEDDLLALLEAQLPEPVTQPIEAGHVRPALKQDAHAIGARWLCLHRRREGHEGDEPEARERESARHRAGPARELYGGQGPTGSPRQGRYHSIASSG